MANLRNTFTEREKIIIDAGMDDPKILRLARLFMANMKAKHPKVNFSLEAAIIVLGEIGIFICKNKELNIDN